MFTVEVNHRYCTGPLAGVVFRSLSDARDYMDSLELATENQPLVTLSLKVASR